MAFHSDNLDEKALYSKVLELCAEFHKRYNRNRSREAYEIGYGCVCDFKNQNNDSDSENVVQEGDSEPDIKGNEIEEKGKICKFDPNVNEFAYLQCFLSHPKFAFKDDSDNLSGILNDLNISCIAAIVVSEVEEGELPDVSYCQYAKNNSGDYYTIPYVRFSNSIDINFRRDENEKINEKIIHAVFTHYREKINKHPEVYEIFNWYKDVPNKVEGGKKNYGNKEDQKQINEKNEKENFVNRKYQRSKNEKENNLIICAPEEINYYFLKYLLLKIVFSKGRELNNISVDQFLNQEIDLNDIFVTKNEKALLEKLKIDDDFKVFFKNDRLFHFYGALVSINGNDKIVAVDYKDTIKNYLEKTIKETDIENKVYLCLKDGRFVTKNFEDIYNEVLCTFNEYQSDSSLTCSTDREEGHKCFQELCQVIEKLEDEIRFPVFPYLFWTNLMYLDETEKMLSCSHIVFPIGSRKYFTLNNREAAFCAMGYHCEILWKPLIVFDDPEKNQFKKDKNNDELKLTFQEKISLEKMQDEICHNFTGLCLEECLKEIVIIRKKIIPIIKKEFREEVQSFIKVNLDLCLDNIPIPSIKVLLNSAFRPLVEQIIDSRYKVKVDEHAENAAVAAIMGRNMSHNIGSHVLTSINLKDVTANNLDSFKDEQARFFTYLQKRMALLAKINSPNADWGEPLFFVKEVLGGFFKQSLLLNNLISDQGGWEKNKISFKCYLPKEDEPLEFKYCDNKKEWLPNRGKINDVLISISDGEIGLQAFYIFCEGLIRNSAKYGTVGNKKKNLDLDSENIDKSELKIYELTFLLKESNDPLIEGSPYVLEISDNKSLSSDELIKKIESTLTSSLVSKVKTNLGILEMREAAKYLQQDLKKDKYRHNDYERYLPLWVKKKNFNNEPFLTYGMHFPRPKIIGMVDFEDLSKLQEWIKDGVYVVNKKENLKAQSSCYQFVVFKVFSKNIDEILEFIRKNKDLLPQRILLLGNENEIIDRLKKEMDRRVAVGKLDEISFESSEKLILSVYESWIVNKWFKDHNYDFYLAINRKKEDKIFNQWEKISRTKVLKDKVNFYLYQTRKPGEEPVKIAERLITDHDSISKYAILYDGHNRFVDSKLYKKFEFSILQNVGNECKKIFETISAVPNDDFSFNYFLLGLIETALVKIMIVDERVADHSLMFNEEEDSASLGRIKNFNRGNIYPVFKVGEEYLRGNIEEKYFNVKEILDDDDQPSDLPHSIFNDSWKKEGFDIVLVHLGLIETFEELNEIESFDQIAPSLIITSGRSSVTVRNDKFRTLPFLEFSIVKENVYPEISKYHLVKSLMSAKGNLKDEE
jgi:hypothetical protein